MSEPLGRGHIDACPYCRGTDTVRAVSCVEDFFFRNVEGSFDFERCKGCGSLFISNPLAPQDLPKAYKTYYTHSRSELGEPQQGIKSRLRQHYVRERFGGRTDFVTKIGAALYRRLAPGLVHVDAQYRFAPPAPARILDYGCGAGTYLRQMQALGYEVTGIDFDPVAIQLLKQDGIAVYAPGDAALDELSEAFDFITINHVIEHVADPPQLLRELSSMLRPGGMLYCEAPNADATGFAVFDRYWRGLEAPRHLSVPSRKGVELALAAADMHEERWFIRDWVRSLTWPLSLDAVPAAERDAVRGAEAIAPGHTLENSEYLMVIARKGARA